MIVTDREGNSNDLKALSTTVDVIVKLNDRNEKPNMQAKTCNIAEGFPHCLTRPT